MGSDTETESMFRDRDVVPTVDEATYPNRVRSGSLKVESVDGDVVEFGPNVRCWHAGSAKEGVSVVDGDRTVTDDGTVDLEPELSVIGRLESDTAWKPPACGFEGECRFAPSRAGLYRPRPRGRRRTWNCLIQTGQTEP